MITSDRVSKKCLKCPTNKENIASFNEVVSDFFVSSDRVGTSIFNLP